jgi:hypothetical protein
MLTRLALFLFVGVLVVGCAPAEPMVVESEEGSFIDAPSEYVERRHSLETNPKPRESGLQER